MRLHVSPAVATIALAMGACEAMNGMQRSCAECGARVEDERYKLRPDDAASNASRFPDKLLAFLAATGEESAARLNPIFLAASSRSWIAQGDVTWWISVGSTS